MSSNINDDDQHIEQRNKNERAAILSRVREALQQETDSHVRAQSSKSPHQLPVIQAAKPVEHEDQLGRRTEFLAPVGNDFAEQTELFRILSEKLQTEFKVVDSIEEARKCFAELVAANDWKRIGRHSNELVDELLKESNLETVSTDHEFDARELEQCDAGVSGCEALIAQTASVLVTAQSSGGRALSVLPPHHVVIATSEQMLGSMVEGYLLLHEKYGADRWPSFISFITGPSRTADVERVLVLGAHGPKRLTVLLIA